MTPTLLVPLRTVGIVARDLNTSLALCLYEPWVEQWGGRLQQTAPETETAYL